VTGIDAAEESIKIAQLHSSQNPRLATNLPKYLHCTAEQLLQADKEKFDVVCSLEVIEHVQNVPQFVSSLCNLLKPGGCLYISTINKTWWSYLTTIVVAENILGLCPPGTHDWHQYITPEDLSKLLIKGGVYPSQRKGISFNLLASERWYIGDDLSANYIIFATKSLQQPRAEKSDEQKSNKTSG